MNKAMLVKQAGVFLSLLLISTAALALSFGIVPKTGTQLPTTVTSTAVAYYTVTNNTGTQRSGNYVSSLPANVTQTTSGGTYGDTCGATFTLAAHGQSGDSCTLQLAITGAVTNPNVSPLFVCISGGKSCNGTAYPLSVSQTSQSTLTGLAVTPTSSTTHVTSTQQYTAIGTYSDNLTADISAAVQWNSSNTAAATIDTNGLATGIAVGSTLISATQGAITSNNAAMSVDNPLVSLAITPTSAVIQSNGTQQFTATGTYADASTLDLSSAVTWNSSDTAAATVDANGLATASASTGVTSISASSDSISSNSATLTVTSFAYVADIDDNRVSYCRVNATTGALSHCTTTGSGFHQPSGIILNAAHTFAYISNFGNGTVSYCTVNSDGTLSDCATTGSGFNNNYRLALNPEGTKLYVPNAGADNVRYCTVNQSSGALSGCANTASSGLDNPVGIVINAANTFAYIANNLGHNVARCVVSPTDGALAACSSTAVITDPVGIALNPAGTFAYVSDHQHNVRYCVVSHITGDLSDCTTTGSGFALPSGVSINSAGAFAYIANYGDHTISKCIVAPGGSLSACASTGSDFLSPFDVTVH